MSVLLISFNITIQNIHFQNFSTAFICKEWLLSPTHTLAKAKALLQNANDKYEKSLHRSDSTVKQTTDISEICVFHIKAASCTNNLPNLISISEFLLYLILVYLEPVQRSLRSD